MEAKVPQRIDMEDRIVGPLTLQQFFYLLFGGLFIYLLNNWTAGTFIRFLFYPVALIIALLSLALAFVKIQDRPFIYFLGAFLNFLLKPKRRIWQRGQHRQLVKIVEDTKKPAATVAHKPYSSERVSELAKVLDNPRKNNDGEKE